MSKKTQRIIVDAFLTVLLIAAMLVQLTGTTLHEIIGAAFFVGIIIHLALSFKWMQATARQVSANKARRRTKRLVIMAVLLGIDIIVLAISSVMISRILASVGLASALMSSFWKGVHTVSSYGISVLTVVHLAMHWSTIFSWVRIPYNPERRAAISTGVGSLAALGIVALGVNCASAMEWVPSEEEKVAPTNQDSLSASSLNDKPATSSQTTPVDPPAVASNDSNSATDSSSSTTPEPPASSSSSGSSDSSSSSSTVSGYCPLCKKRCPLSAPQCDRPYREGIL